MTNPYEETQGVGSILVKVVEQVAENADLKPYLKATSVSESLKDLHERLLFVRGRQERISELVGTLIRIQANVRKVVLDRRSELTSAEANAAGLTKQPWVEDYSSGRERNAKLTAKTLDEHVALTAANKLQVDADAALAYAQNVYRELGNQAYDVSTRIKILGMEGNLGPS